MSRKYVVRLAVQIMSPLEPRNRGARLIPRLQGTVLEQNNPHSTLKLQIKDIRKWTTGAEKGYSRPRGPVIEKGVVYPRQTRGRGAAIGCCQKCTSTLPTGGDGLLDGIRLPR